MHTENAKPSQLTRVEFLVLAALHGGPRHGYGIAQEIQARTAGHVRLRPGSLYRVLERLTVRGLLEAGAESSNDRRRLYELTHAGRDVLQHEARVLHNVAAHVLPAE